MGKTNQLKKHKKKRAGGYNGGKDDRISELPDEILIFILSLLTLEEAARTSVFSIRWKTLWANLPSLRFDGSKILGEILLGHKSIKTETSKFRGSVNQVVKSFQGGSNLEEFRLCFDLHQSHKVDINSWVHFAIRKGVKVLELDLADYLGGGQYSRTSYTFPCLMLMPTHGKCLRSRSLSFSGCNSLTFLRLNYVDVTQEFIDYLLSSCRFLDQLFIEYSRSLVDLKIDGPSLKLRILKICGCTNVKNIQISANELVSFTYTGDKMHLSLKNVPRLVELYFDGLYSTRCSLSYVLRQLSNYIFQLESLTLSFVFFMETIEFCQMPVLNNLKHLKFIVRVGKHESLLPFSSLIEACPFLCKFSLELSISKLLSFSRGKIERITPRCPLNNLKVIEFIGFVGLSIDMELATYLIENSCELEKVIFDTRDPLFMGATWYELTKEERAAKRRAKQFGKKLPRGLDLVII